MYTAMIGTLDAIPIQWEPRTSSEQAPVPTQVLGPVTVIPWQGRAHIPGAFLLSRINLSFINQTCNSLTSNLDVSTQVAGVLTNFTVSGASSNQIKRYGYVMLKIEAEFSEVLEYVTSLVLCPGRGSELWSKYTNFNRQITQVWKLLRKAGVRSELSEPELFPRRRPNSNISDSISLTPVNDILISLLETSRPSPLGQPRSPRSPLLIGLGIGFLATHVLGQYFGGNTNDKDISILNDNIQKQNKNIRVTNERIDMLATNVSRAVTNMKSILDKLVEAQETADIHYAILWNLDQLVSSTINIRNVFKFSELTVTLLHKGILNADLINVTSLERIVAEGQKTFPHLEFPLPIGRYDLTHIVKILKVQLIGHHQFVMVIPLTHIQDYEVFRLVPHPVKLGTNTLVLPEMKDILLKDATSYILTNTVNMYSISAQDHLLLDVEPIYNHQKATCEWEGFKKNITAMLALCTYNEVGHFNDTMVIETDQHRLIYFSKPTKVSLDCPDKQVRDNLIGFHKLPLACDIKTDFVFWPAKQTITIELNDTDSFKLDSTYLPIIDVNRTSKVHTSLRELLNRLPKDSDPFTIDFNYYDLTLERIQTYSIYAQTILTVIVVINSLIVGFLLIKWIYTRKQKTVQHKFEGLRDSFRSKKNNINRESLRNFRTSIRSRTRTLSDSIHSKGSGIKQKVQDGVAPFPNLVRKVAQIGFPSALTSPTTVTAGTNTNVNWQIPASVPGIYPAIPRYI